MIEQQHDNFGKIILLNGASSSGKTTLALALQDKISEPFWHYSIDHFREADILPMKRIKDGDFDWAQMREPFFNGFHHSIATFAQTGNNLIVEHIVETQEWMDRLVVLLSSFDIFFVGVHCELEELEKRARARGNGKIEEARNDYGIVHTFGEYDLELDTSDATTEQNVTSLLDAWSKRPHDHSFLRMKAQYLA